ncbi:hypothetical protein BSLG_004279 [Batrachochytrium salamandrivorans]|nr:hypothetical protein BSLG_004279 [Batrachochytrium salamandrivorans]
MCSLADDLLSAFDQRLGVIQTESQQQIHRVTAVSKQHAQRRLMQQRQLIEEQRFRSIDPPEPYAYGVRNGVASSDRGGFTIRSASSLEAQSPHPILSMEDARDTCGMLIPYHRRPRVLGALRKPAMLSHQRRGVHPSSRMAAQIAG